MYAEQTLLIKLLKGKSKTSDHPYVRERGHPENFVQMTPLEV